MKELPASPLSLWLDTYGPYTPEPPLAGDTRADVAIIGGGFTGLATACALKRAEPSLDVALLEARTAGYGASGRNGSFGMTVVGLGFATTALVRGKPFVRALHASMERAVDTLEALVRREQLDCDLIRPGFLRVATSQKYAKRIRHEIELTDCPFVNRSTVQWPPEPLRMATAVALRGYLRLEDWVRDPRTDG